MSATIALFRSDGKDVVRLRRSRSGLVARLISIHGRQFKRLVFVYIDFRQSVSGIRNCCIHPTAPAQGVVGQPYQCLVRPCYWGCATQGQGYLPLVCGRIVQARRDVGSCRGTTDAGVAMDQDTGSSFPVGEKGEQIIDVPGRRFDQTILGHVYVMKRQTEMSTSIRRTRLREPATRVDQADNTLRCVELDHLVDSRQRADEDVHRVPCSGTDLCFRLLALIERGDLFQLFGDQKKPRRMRPPISLELRTRIAIVFSCPNLIASVMSSSKSWLWYHQRLYGL